MCTSATLRSCFDGAWPGAKLWGSRWGQVLEILCLPVFCPATRIEPGEPFMALTPAPTHSPHPRLPYPSPPCPWGAPLAENPSEIPPVSPPPLFSGFQNPSDPAVTMIGSSGAPTRQNRRIGSL